MDISNFLSEIQYPVSEDGQWQWINNDWHYRPQPETSAQPRFDTEVYRDNVLKPEADAVNYVRNTATNVWNDYITPNLPQLPERVNDCKFF